MVERLKNKALKTNLSFTFEKLGPVQKADLELGDLTVIAGANNTGKTYIAYTGILPVYFRLRAGVLRGQAFSPAKKWDLPWE